ncbi:hypothetical protein PGB90_010331 [Kerria lacca]
MTDTKEERKNFQHDKEVTLCYLSIRKLAFITVALPFIALFLCFVTAYVFRYDDVHETHCRVFNVIPSISAITGITPQTYLWRICIALHIGPRILVAHLYKNYLSNLAKITLNSNAWIKKFFISSCYWFNMIELSSLCGVTYVSNRENYPFTWFAFSEYVIASCNMGFHLTVAMDFPDERLVVNSGFNSFPVKKFKSN